MTMERDIEKYTNDYLLDEFEKVNVKYRRRKVLEILDFYKPKNVLEIGCGTQSLFDFYTAYDSFTVVEPSRVFCDLIKSSANFNSKITVINDFFENVPPPPSDFIVLSGLLPEIKDPEKLLLAVKHSCTRDTIIHINVSNANSFHKLWGVESGLLPNIGVLSDTAKKYQLYSIYNLEKLEEILRKNGFEPFENGSYFLKIFNNAKMEQAINYALIDERLLDGLYNLAKYFPENGSEIYINCRIK